MTYADEIRRQAEAAPRAGLPAVTAALWKAYGDGQITEAEAEALSGLIEGRRQKVGKSDVLRSPVPGRSPDPAGSTNTEKSGIASDRQGGPRRSVGSRPRTDASMERRRRWAASGRLPPAIAARFTLAEQGVLALVAAEVARRKDCRLAVGNLAAIVGVAETTVRNAIREAVKLGLVTVEERRITGFRNDTNIVRIVSAEWMAWLRLTRKPARDQGNPDTPASQGGGCKSPKGTPTEVLDLGKTRPAEPQKGCREAAVDFGRSDPVRIRASGRTGRAMR
ncbi:MAG: helix-turn-helix domain-containing protein [Methylorubrum extorquens]|uniref:helix-turn-helix domain-containing protein n=1 Tax=Methylobacteriaceae TaxID=119045 RepID=UPI0019CF6589|nr:helix-turn-helix domain-containing protein [Methylobacterium organophilum]MBN6824115.1 helix-turn-helix domain-containing protein [Methylobacterium organophilum]